MSNNIQHSAGSYILIMAKTDSAVSVTVPLGLRLVEEILAVKGANILLTVTTSYHTPRHELKEQAR
jgi:hypothetical protein